MSFGKRCTLACSALVLLALALALVSLHSTRQLGQDMRSVSAQRVPRMLELGQIQITAYDFRGDVWKHIGSVNRSEMSVIENKMERSRQAVLDRLNRYERAGGDPQTTVRLRDAWASYEQKWLEIRERSRTSQQVSIVYDQAMRELHPRFVELAGQLTQANQREEESVSSTGRAAMASAHRAETWIWSIGIFVLFAGVLISWWLTRGINASVRALAGEMSVTAQHVARAAAQISESSQALASGATEHSASIEETSATAEEISATARRNAETASSAAGVMTSLAGNFRHTDEKLEQMVAAMGEISSSSTRIGNIIKVIDEIAFQTNILALNAAVEAARAGAAGAGFAVVADEVRNLAQRSAQAARETASLIEESINRSRDGAAQVDEVAISVRRVAADSAHVKHLIDEVSTGSQEQTVGVQQISIAIRQMEKIAQHSAASAEECAAVAEELAAQSKMLHANVQHLAGQPA